MTSQLKKLAFVVMRRSMHVVASKLLNEIFVLQDYQKYIYTNLYCGHTFTVKQRAVKLVLNTGANPSDKRG